MSTHDRTVLASYVFGALPADESAAITGHLVSCASCHAEVSRLKDVVVALDSVPPEALLDGPIADGDVLLAKLLREAAGGSRRRPWPRWLRLAGAAAAAVVLLAAGFGGGLLAGQQTSPSAAGPTSVRTATAHDAMSGVGMVIDLSSFNGWVDIQGRFTGVTPGATCRIVLVTRSGERVVAGVWIAPPNARTSVVTVDGSAIVPPVDVVSAEVDTISGRRLVIGSF